MAKINVYLLRISGTDRSIDFTFRYTTDSEAWDEIFTALIDQYAGMTDSQVAVSLIATAKELYYARLRRGQELAADKTWLRAARFVGKSLSFTV